MASLAARKDGVHNMCVCEKSGDGVKYPFSGVIMLMSLGINRYTQSQHLMSLHAYTDL